MSDFAHLDPSARPRRRKGAESPTVSSEGAVTPSEDVGQKRAGVGDGNGIVERTDASLVRSRSDSNGKTPQLSSAAGPSNGAAAKSLPASSRPAIQRPQIKRPTFNAVLVNGCQRGNPILQHIRNVPWEYGDIVPDYQVGTSHCIIFLSLRYHRLHPEYIHTRVKSLGQMYVLRVLLVMCDVDHHQEPIKELIKIGVINNLTLIVAWSPQEAGRYIESYKALEHKPPDLIRERPETDYISLLTQCLTNIRGVNKTDVMTLISNFGSLRQIAQTIRDRPEEIGMCPGFGELKTRRLIEAFEASFLVRDAKASKRTRLNPANA